MLIANGYIASRLYDNLVLYRVYRAAGYTGLRDLTAHIVVAVDVVGAFGIALSEVKHHNNDHFSCLNRWGSQPV